MTLVATYIGKYGIVHVADSNVTNTDNSTIPPVRTVEPGQKAFKVPHLNAGLTVAGSYSVGGQNIPEWLEMFIRGRSNLPEDNLGDFAASLKIALEQQMFPEEINNGSIIHLAGYVSSGALSHPEFWFIRNVHGIDENTGAYNNIREEFAISEDFWSRDCYLINNFEQGAYYLYANGFHGGRIPFFEVEIYLREFFLHVWSQPDWGLRAPSSVQDMEKMIRLYMNIVTTVFEVGGNVMPLIGGNIQTVVIPAPLNTVICPQQLV